MVFADRLGHIVVKCVPPENVGVSSGGVPMKFAERDNFVQSSPQDRKEQIVRPTRACAVRAQTIATDLCPDVYR